MAQFNSIPELRLCILAHDLNNKLGVIGGHAQLLAEHAETLNDPAFEKHLFAILQAVEYMTSRINGYECRMYTCAAQEADRKQTSR